MLIKLFTRRLSNLPPSFKASSLRINLEHYVLRPGHSNRCTQNHPDLNRVHINSPLLKSLYTPTSALVKLGDTYELKEGGFLKVKDMKRHTKSLAAVGSWMFRPVSETKGLPRLDPDEVY